jgi:hypothetical protein
VSTVNGNISIRHGVALQSSELSDLMHGLFPTIIGRAGNSEVLKEVLSIWVNMEINCESVKLKLCGIKRDLTSVKYE